MEVPLTQISPLSNLAMQSDIGHLQLCSLHLCVKRDLERWPLSSLEVCILSDVACGIHADLTSPSSIY